MQELAPPRAGTRRALLLVLLAAALVVLVGLNLPGAAPAALEAAREARLGAVRTVRNLALGPPIVGIQIGHLAAADHPEELAKLRASTGGFGNGIFEVDVNREVAAALAARLGGRGVTVDLLPATVPPRYRADLVVSIHADSSPEDHRRGYKSAVFQPQRNRWDALLKAELDRAYLAGSGLPDDDANVTGDMLEYYAFNRRYRHSVSRSTPAAIVELGYLSHPADLLLLRDADRVASYLEAGIVAFLRQRGRLPREPR